MKKRFLMAQMALVLASVAPPAAAAPFDLASYLALTPGNWSIMQDNASGQQFGYVSSANTAGQVVQTWYRLKAGVWEFDVAEIFAVSGRRITYVGSNDGVHDWVFEPALTLRRQQDVNDTTVYKGVQRNTTTGEVIPVAMVLTFTAEGIATTTPAGSFTGCIKSRTYSVGGGTSRDSVGISCPGRQEVMSWYHKIRDTASPTVMDQSETHSSVSIAGGASGAPIP